MSARLRPLWLALGTLVLLLLALNFLSFRLARSNTEVNSTISTARAGESLPVSMNPGFTQFYAINGNEQLAAELATALETELQVQTSIGEVRELAAEENANAPFLVIDVAGDRLWTPVYGRATVTALLYYAPDGEAPWPLDEPLVLESSPALKAFGEFTLVDSSWGLLSRPAYIEHLAQELAEKIVEALQNDVFRPPSP